MYHVDLYSGLGGFALACEWNGIETVCFCEIDKFCQKVIKKHWPNVPIVEDVNDVEEIKRIVANATGDRRARQRTPIAIQERWTEQRPEPAGKLERRPERPLSLLLTAGFPCQPFSAAGRRRGKDDHRYLWPQTMAVITAIRPDWVLLENVAGILSMVFPDGETGVASQASFLSVPADEIADYPTIIGGIERDLRQAGYETVWLVIPACSLGAPHRRDRVWILAFNASSNRWECGGNYLGRGQILDTSIGQIAENQQIGDGRFIGTSARDSDATNAIRGRLSVCGTERRTWASGEWSRSPSDAPQADILGGWQENWYEVAQRFCVLDARLSSGLAGCRLKPVTHGIMGLILMLRRFHYATSEESRSREVLPVLRGAFAEEDYQRAFGRLGSLYSPEELRCPLHGTSNGERESATIGNKKKGRELQGNEVREVQCNQESSSSPHGFQPSQQCTCQYDDVVWELSSEMALGEWQNRTQEAEGYLYDLWQSSRGERLLYEPLEALQEIWRSLTDKEIGAFRRHFAQRDKQRVPKLKALGNAIVPQVASEIIRAIKESGE